MTDFPPGVPFAGDPSTGPAPRPSGPVAPPGPLAARPDGTAPVPLASGPVAPEDPVQLHRELFGEVVLPPHLASVPRRPAPSRDVHLGSFMSVGDDAEAPHSVFPDLSSVERRLRATAWLVGLAIAGGAAAVVAVLWSVSAWLGGLALTLVLLAVSVSVLTAVFAGRQLLRLEGLHPVGARTQPALHRMLLDVAARMGVDAPPCYVLDERSPNAFVAMAGPRKRMVVVTSGFLDVATPRQLRGALAHELAHLRNHDVLVKALAATVTFPSASDRPSRPSRRRPSDRAVEVAVEVASVAVANSTAAVFALVSRSRESLADVTAARALGGALPMLDCLRMLGNKASSPSSRLALLRSHPGLRSRIRLLEQHCGRQGSRLPPSR